MKDNEKFYKKVLIQRIDRKSIFNLNFKHDAFYEIIFYDLLSPAYILNNLFKELLGKACIIYSGSKDKESKLLKTPSTRLLKKKRSHKFSPPPCKTISVYFKKKDRRYVKFCLEKLLNRLREVGYIISKEIIGV